MQTDYFHTIGLDQTPEECEVLLAELKASHGATLTHRSGYSKAEAVKERWLKGVHGKLLWRANKLLHKR